MFLLSNICGCVPNLFLTRGISCSSTCHNNHYMTLGLTPAATQVEIKKAYFELCKKYHPDKNEGSTESTKMFRKITEAYEILGNEKSRRLYDQKMFYAGPTMRHTVRRPEDYNYEAERYFYERTNLRRRYTGKTPQYDFDAWVNAHYPRFKGDEYRMRRDGSRSWRKSSESARETTYRKRIRLVTINIIGFLIIGFVLTSMPALYVTHNYGIENLDKRVKLAGSQSKNVEPDEEKPLDLEDS